MGSTISVIKTLIVPAVISLLLFLLSSYAILPLWRRYRERYSHYLPLETISNQTQSFRQRIQGALGRFLVPSVWRQRLHDRLVVGNDDGSDIDFESEDGEELGVVDVDSQREHAEATRRDRPDDTRRLSRDLEEGFRDDSDDESNRANSRGDNI